MDKVVAKCAVLLAYHNGSQYLKEQLSSLASQVGVDVHVFISDDSSSEMERIELLRIAFGSGCAYTLLPPVELGGSGRNFYRLVCDVDTSLFDYVSFCDQDDIWFSRKLLEDIGVIERAGVAGVSSPTTPYYSDNCVLSPRKLPGRFASYDYIFESAGQGCTYTTSQEFFSDFSVFVRENLAAVNEVYFHDWLLYAFSRKRGYGWVFHNISLLYYRQHAENVMGVRSGFGSFLKRYKLLSSGWYFSESKKICSVLGDDFWQTLAVDGGLTLSKVRFLIFNILNFRRARVESLLIFLFVFKATCLSEEV